MRKIKYGWPSAFGLSLLGHGALLCAVAGLMLLFPPPQPNREPIEVDLVADVGGGGGGGNHNDGGGGGDGSGCGCLIAIAVAVVLILIVMGG